MYTGFKKLLTGLFVALILIAQPVYADDPIYVECQSDTNTYCASSTNPIVASYSHMAYWSLSGLLWKFAGIGADFDAFGDDNHQAMFEDSYIKLWAGFIYILSITAALIMMALGQPPKLYGWFAMGPALFYFLLFNHVERAGVAWKVGNKFQDQRVVWELSSSGINSNPMFNVNIGGSGGSSSGQTRDIDFLNLGVNNNISVPFYFALVDDATSEAVQNFVGIFGLQDDLKEIRGEKKPDVPTDQWILLSTEKWELLEDITAARVYNNDFREFFIEFIASECGDKVGDYMRDLPFITSSTTDGEDIPLRMICNPELDECDRVEKEFLADLRSIRIPAPYSYTQLVSINRKASELKFDAAEHYVEYAFWPELTATEIKELPKVQTIACDDWMWMIVEGFRWEAAIQYAGLAGNLNYGLSDDVNLDPDLVNYVFLYDWQFTNQKETQEGFDNEDRKRFMINLIMMYMMRNEYAIAPKIVRQRMLPSERSIFLAEEFNRNINGKNKFAEFYVWAKLMPHMQGLLIYILAIGYPFACLMILIPGWWKWIFTWTSFFVWAKSWDIGFAIVASLEKSIWGNIGNSLEAARVNQRVLGYEAPFDAFAEPEYFDNHVWVNGTDPFASPGATSPANIPEIRGTRLELDNAFDIFEQGFILSRVLQHDLANSYYIYLMSALYMMVPAVTGQVLLGAKSGVANMVREAIGGVSQEAGSAAKAGAVGELTRLGGVASSVNEHAAIAKGMRANGLATKAMNAKNTAMQMEMIGDSFKAQAELMGLNESRARDRGEEISNVGALSLARMRMTSATVGGFQGAVDALLPSDEVQRKFMQDAREKTKAGHANVKDPQGKNKDGGGTPPVPEMTPGDGGPLPGSSAPGPSGSAPSGSDGRLILPENLLDLGGKASTGLRMANSGWFGPGVAYGDFASQVANSRAAKYRLEAGQQARSMNALVAEKGFGIGQQARANSEMSQRYQTQAEYAAGRAAHSQQRQFASDSADWYSAMGAVAGTIDSKHLLGQISNINHIGAGGQGSQAYTQAFGYASSGFFSDVKNYSQGVQAAGQLASQRYDADIGANDRYYGNNFVTAGAYAYAETWNELRNGGSATRQTYNSPTSPDNRNSQIINGPGKDELHHYVEE